jgi:cytochrome c oxidase assembly protein subunit 15
MDSALVSSAPPRTGLQPRPRALSSLLFLVAALVFAMVVVGGITRLTESGLSITEWKPISGAIPPLSPADWDRAFDLYRATPEYQQINGPAGMTLAQFKHIYWWEFVHRLLGRMIGLVFAACWCSAARRGFSDGTWSCPACRSARTSVTSACPLTCSLRSQS